MCWLLSSDTATLLAVCAVSMAPVQAEPFVSFRVAVLILSTMTLPLSFWAMATSVALPPFALLVPHLLEAA